MTRPPYTEFRRRLAARQPVVGTFVKTPTSHATEMLGLLGFDFVVFDGEHAPLDLGTIDRMVLGARASNVAGIVRVASPADAAILSVLDCGAAGVLVPHVATRAKAEAIAAACRYAGGHRGFANTTRAGRYGMASFAEHKAAQDGELVCVAMIEDVAALDEIAAIVRTPGLDAIFIGRGDLTAALGAPSMTSEETHRVVAPIMAAARDAGMPMIMLCPDRADAERMAGLGATAFMTGSDHGFMIQGARAALAALKPVLG
jgi:staphyloferrin B biosynthesis citrate synthase